MIRAFSWILFAALAIASCQVQSADPLPTPKSTVKFPVLPVKPVDDKKAEPTTPPANDIPVLDEGVYYVIHDDAPFITYASPANLVHITKTTGPVKLLGKFIDGTGDFEEKEYKSKNVTIIRAKAQGRVELIVNAVGAVDESTAQRKLIDVISGQGPIPPPKPVVPVTPTEVKSFRVIFVIESGSTPTAAQLGVSDAKLVRDYLTAKCTKEGEWPGWRRYDPDADVTNEQPTMKALWEAVKPKITSTPCLVVETNGKVDILPYPKNSVESLSLLKKYAEGK